MPACSTARSRRTSASAAPTRDYDEVHAAAEAAAAQDFILSKSDGYDTLVGERGSQLSGGERQRIAIARAILKDAPILVLDEATSALDVETEARVKEAIDSLRQDRTTFIIAHRLTTVRDADLVVFMDNGRVVEMGGFAELSARNGRFASLLRAGGLLTDEEVGASAASRSRAKPPSSRLTIRPLTWRCGACAPHCAGKPRGLCNSHERHERAPPGAGPTLPIRRISWRWPTASCRGWPASRLVAARRRALSRLHRAGGFPAGHHGPDHVHPRAVRLALHDVLLADGALGARHAGLAPSAGRRRAEGGRPDRRGVHRAGARSPARSGASRCGAPGGSGTRG